jgi:hypothetical protein
MAKKIQISRDSLTKLRLGMNLRNPWLYAVTSKFLTEETPYRVTTALTIEFADKIEQFLMGRLKEEVHKPDGQAKFMRWLKREVAEQDLFEEILTKLKERGLIK